MSQNEKIVETKTCRQCSVSFDITDKDLEFYEKVSPVFGRKKYSIPTPTLCPDCRQQRRLAFRNERKLYKRKCDATNNDIITIYSPDYPGKVYEASYWWSDKWDAIAYGKDFDFSKSFFKQFGELLLEVPHISRMVVNCENSEYVNGALDLKNCYLCFNCDKLEDSYYSYTCNNGKNLIDCYMLLDSENCYRSFNCFNGFNLKYSNNSIDCSDSLFLDNCINCKNCFCCNNLINKDYCAFNKQYTKEEYISILKNTLLKYNIDEIYEKFSEFSNNFPKKYYFGKNNENFSGDYVYNSHNIKNCHSCYNLEYSKNCFYVYDSKNCMDYDIYGDNSSLVYEGVMVGSNIYKSAFNIGIWGGCSDMYCCFLCVNNCKNCFGCIGLKNKEYCIFNKQYTKEEYEELVPKIIEQMQKTGEWGEFFSADLNPFCYNETLANDFYPLEKKDALKLGFKWLEENDLKEKSYLYEPLDIMHYDENHVGGKEANKNKRQLLDGILKCKLSGKYFKIITPELEFYIRNFISIPDKHPEVRYKELLLQRKQLKLYNRTCDKCRKEIETTYSPERSEIVYCQKCYESEIY